MFGSFIKSSTESNHKQQLDKVQFFIDVYYHGKPNAVKLRSQLSIDKWAQNTDFNDVMRFNVFWGYEFHVWNGLPALPAVPPLTKKIKTGTIRVAAAVTEDEDDAFLVSVKYYSSDSLTDLRTKLFRALAWKSVDIRKVWFGAMDYTDPTTVKPLNFSVMYASMPDVIVNLNEEYPNVEMHTIASFDEFTGKFRSTAENSFTSAELDNGLADVTKAYLSVLQAEKAAELLHISNLAVAHLILLAKSFHMDTCYIQATCRQIVDVFVAYAAAFVGTPCKVNATVKVVEAPGNDAYIGHGPFDYFIEAPVPVIILTIHDRIDDPENPVPEEQLQDVIDTMIRAGTEAKNEIIMVHFARLLAQMLDQYKSAKLKNAKLQAAHLKRTAEGHAKAASAPVAAPADSAATTAVDSTPATHIQIRGILTTGQKHMFFSLQDAGGPLPKLRYFGTHSVDILPRFGYSRSPSGLEYDRNEKGVFVPRCGVDERQVRALLEDFIVFFDAAL